MEEISNCPLCGGVAKLHRSNNAVPAPSWTEFAQISCTKCGCNVQASSDAGFKNTYELSATDRNWDYRVFSASFTEPINFDENELIERIITKWNRRTVVW